MQRYLSIGFAGFLLMSVASLGHAQAIQVRIPLEFEVYDPCNDEILIGEVVAHPLLLPDGVQRSNSNGTAVGLTTGTLYESNGNAILESDVIEDGNVVTFLTTGTSIHRLTSHGSNPDLILTTKFEFVLVVTFDPVTGIPIDFQQFNNSVEVVDCRACQD